MHHDHAGPVGRERVEQRPRAVRGPVVHDDELDRGRVERLSEHGVQEPADPALDLVGRDHDADDGARPGGLSGHGAGGTRVGSTASRRGLVRKPTPQAPCIVANTSGSRARTGSGRPPPSYAEASNTAAA